MILGQAFTRFVLDLDGVVWTGDEPLPGAPETVRALRESGKRLAFLTNNSSRTPMEYAKRLAGIGAGGDPKEVVTSAAAAARLLAATVPGLRGRATFVVGGEGLREAVESTGARIVEGEDGADATLVVVGWDLALTYDTLRIATLAIRSGATFVASNADLTYPAAGGLWPGTGAILAALRAATGVEPAIAGKPEPAMFEIARERVGGDPALVIGDRLDTDVAGAARAGWPSALVLTGAHGVPDLATAAAWPDYVLRGLPALLEDLPHPRVRPATGPDLPPIASLLHGGGLVAGAARERVGRTVVAADSDRRVIATAAWDPAGDAAMLRSVAVDATHRGRGVGALVTAAALRAAVEAGRRTFYLATRDADPFFERCGFTVVKRAELPDEVADHPQISRECPAGAPVMRLAV